MKKNININILVLIFLILLFMCMYVYAEKNVDYEIENIEISYLFEDEQVIKNKYYFDLELENVEKITPKQVENNSVEIVNNVEIMSLEGLRNIKVENLEEEIQVANYMSFKDIENEVGSSEETHFEKLYRLFGADAEFMDGRVLYYPTEDDALNNMKTFGVKVWDLNENGEWYQKNWRLTCHKSLVKTMKCIFEELLNLPEEDRVPIEIMGCYNYRNGTSAHSCGAAIDINWTQNAEMTNTGKITAGAYWKPNEDIYSIKSDSPFVHIFEKYGWTWGGYWTCKKDYMHFSYLDR